MAKEYQNRRQNFRKKNNRIRNLSFGSIIFICGYFFGYIFYKYNLNLFIDKLFSEQGEQKTIISKQKHIPKFEFYTLLSKDSSPPKVQHNKTIATKLDISLSKPVSNNTSNMTSNEVRNYSAKVVDAIKVDNTKIDNYLIQVAAFNKSSDAEKLKVSLLFKGYKASILTIENKGIIWYRVIIGPFNNKLLAQRKQQVIAQREHLNGMIRKI